MRTFGGLENNEIRGSLGSVVVEVSAISRVSLGVMIGRRYCSSGLRAWAFGALTNRSCRAVQPVERRDGMPLARSAIVGLGFDFATAGRPA
jgi:hypothetical protein